MFDVVGFIVFWELVFDGVGSLVFCFLNCGVWG